MTDRREAAYHEEWCDTCTGTVEANVNCRSGQYHVSMPAKCQTKDACTVRIVEGMGFAGLIPRVVTYVQTYTTTPKAGD